MRLRFFGALTHASRKQIVRFTQIDYDRAMAFVALDGDDGALLGVSRLASDPERAAAEFAVLVRSDRQGEGIGFALMCRLIDFAKSDGVGALWGDVLADNDGMRRLCEKLGFVRDYAASGDGLVRWRLPLRDLSDVKET